MPYTIFKQCGCGEIYTRREWLHLLFVGNDHEARLELRNCICGSTIALEYNERGKLLPDNKEFR